MQVPKYEDLFNPILQALHELGGSASVAELEDKVIQIMSLVEEQISQVHSGSRTKLDYNLAWARYYLKSFGLIDNSKRGIWTLTPKGLRTNKINVEELIRFVKNKSKNIEKGYSELPLKEALIAEEVDKNVTWKEELLEELKKLSAKEFERLCQRILREAGFIHVQVTGKTNDKGIDGIGTIRVGGFISFKVYFQCKKYQNTVSSPDIREFKGTMVGRAERGLFITTGRFTKEAEEEANRDGAPPIDLIDGKLLVEKMKDLGLGVQVKMEEVIEVDKDWFNNI